MDKSTPGPWTIVDEREIYAGDATIATVLDTAEGLEGDCPQARANAHLISAAPDLLAACEATIEQHKRLWVKRGEEPRVSEELRTVYDAIVAAIAKARGGQS